MSAFAGEVDLGHPGSRLRTSAPPASGPRSSHYHNAWRVADPLALIAERSLPSVLSTGSTTAHSPRDVTAVDDRHGPHDGGGTLRTRIIATLASLAALAIPSVQSRARSRNSRRTVADDAISAPTRSGEHEWTTGSRSGTDVSEMASCSLPPPRSTRWVRVRQPVSNSTRVSTRGLIRPAHGLIPCAAAMASADTVLGSWRDQPQPPPSSSAGDGSKDEGVTGDREGRTGCLHSACRPGSGTGDRSVPRRQC